MSVYVIAWIVELRDVGHPIIIVYARDIIVCLNIKMGFVICPIIVHMDLKSVGPPDMYVYVWIIESSIARHPVMIVHVHVGGAELRFVRHSVMTAHVRCMDLINVKKPRSMIVHVRSMDLINVNVKKPRSMIVHVRNMDLINVNVKKPRIMIVHVRSMDLIDAKDPYINVRV